jgi:hypothetical protein
MCFDEKLNKWALFKKFVANFVLTSNLEPEGNTTGNFDIHLFLGYVHRGISKNRMPRCNAIASVHL